MAHARSNSHRRGGGQYRAIYIIRDDEPVIVCVVLMVAPHENIYRKAESRFEALLKSLE